MHSETSRTAVLWAAAGVFLGLLAALATITLAGTGPAAFLSPGYSLTAGLLLAAGALSLFGLARSVRSTEPVNELTEALERMAHGDNSVHLDEHTGRLSGVTKCVNTLAHALEERSRSERTRYYEAVRLKEKSDGLEQRLSAVNADLSRKDLLLKEVNSELIHANRAKTEFISRMGRELRLPLNTIAGLADFLEQGRLGPLNDRQRDYIKKISDRASDLMDVELKILEYSQLDYAGKPAYRELRLGKVAEDVCRSLEPFARSRGVEIVPNITDVTVSADPDKLRCIIHDLLHNAIKFNEPGGRAYLYAGTAEPGSVKERMERAGRDCPWDGVELVEITVEDTGRGIHPSRLQELFKPFTHLTDESAESPGGAGLSLFLVRKFTELHCGRVWVERRAGGGSRFCVAMPLHPICAPGDTPSQKSRILIVEDDPDQMNIVSRFLAREPYELIKASDGIEALRLIEEEAPDLILLDVMLPGMGGIEVCESVKRLDMFRAVSRVPVIIMTSHTDMENRLRAVRAGADDVIFKPLNRSLLTERIKSLLGYRDEIEGILASYRNLERDVHVDPLTGVFNRRHMDEVLTREFLNSRRYERSLSVLMMDLDHFKNYNDRLGHVAGDELLRKVAAIFTENVREVDVVARYGGEEFMVILPETPPDLALVAAERIRKAVQDGAATTISIGQASFPEDADELHELISRADAALYGSKAAGRNRVFSYGKSLRASRVG